MTDSEVNRTVQEKIDTSEEEEDFDWSEYLKKTKSEPAARECFAQNAIPPKNEFQVGNKLETNDPRNTSSICLATIIEIAGPRLRLRLDGTDNRNDFWLMCDSDLLHPFEYSTKNGRKIQPPLGYGNDLSKWPKFLEKIINLSHKNNLFAPETAFKQPPVKPARNEFKVAQKLEAVDPKNPDLICPATVKEVNRDKILISFDGWSSSSQFWIPFYSRDLFPCGWCKETGHLIQHPGYLEQKQSKTTTKSSRTNKNSPGDSLNESESKNLKENCGVNQMIDLSKVKTEAVEQDMENEETENLMNKSRVSNVTLYVRPKHNCGKFINSSKFHKSHTKFGPGQPANVYRSIVQSFIDCAVNRMQVFQMIPEGNGNQLLRYKTSSSCVKKKLNLVGNNEQMWTEIQKVCEIFEIDECKLFSTVPVQDLSDVEIKKSPKEARIENKENDTCQSKEKLDEFPLTPKASSCSSSTSSFNENLARVNFSQANSVSNKRRLSIQQMESAENYSASKINRKNCSNSKIYLNFFFFFNFLKKFQIGV